MTCLHRSFSRRVAVTLGPTSFVSGRQFFRRNSVVENLVRELLKKYLSLSSWVSEVPLSQSRQQLSHSGDLNRLHFSWVVQILSKLNIGILSDLNGCPEFDNLFLEFDDVLTSILNHQMMSKETSIHEMESYQNMLRNYRRLDWIEVYIAEGRGLEIR